MTKRPTQISVASSNSEIVPRVYVPEYDRKRLFYTPECISSIQKKIEEIASKEKGLTKVALVAKAAKELRIPVTFTKMYAFIKYPESYEYARQRTHFSEQDYRDIAALFMGGASSSIIAMITESAQCNKPAIVLRYMQSTTPKDVERVKEKYKDVLMLYGVYDHFAYDKKNMNVKSKNERTRDECAEKNYNLMFTPDQVKKFVAIYNSLPVSNIATLNSDLHEVMRRCGISVHPNRMKRALFAHKHLAGYEDIDTPDVKNFPPNSKTNIGCESLIAEIRYLRDVKKWIKSKIAKTLGLDPDFVARAYDALVRPDIKVSPEMKKIFDERYKGVK